MTIRQCFLKRLRILIIFCLGLMAIVVAPVNAQNDSSWFAWLYDASAGQMIRVSEDGTSTTLILPLLDNSVAPPDEVAVAPDGITIAYVVRSIDDSAPTLMIYNSDQRAVLATYPPPSAVYHSLQFATRLAFSPDSTRLAFGYSLEPSGWEMVFIDIANLAVMGTLRSGDNTAAGLRGDFGVTPTPLHIRSDGRVGFALVPGGTDTVSPFAAYVWNPTDNAVNDSSGYVDPNADLFVATGEFVLALPDDRLPNQSDAFDFRQNNSLQVFIPITGTRTPFYNDETRSFSQVRFVANGQHVLARGTNQDSAGVWMLVSRAGTVLGELSVDYRAVGGTHDGALLLVERDGATILEHLDLMTQGASTELIWQSDPGVTNLQLAWVGGWPQDILPDYVTWATLTEDTRTDATENIPSTTTPNVDSDFTILQVGGIATVSTTGGDALRMRTGPGVEFAIIERLPRGTQVTLIDGPREADGFAWWQIRTSNGREGWAVAATDDLETLVPGRTAANPGGEVDESLEGAADPTLPNLLEVGGEVVVTLGNPSDVLRLRNAPGTSTEIIALLPDGTQLSVTDGPRELDGYVWWQLRTPEGNSGWAAEIVGNQRTLVAVATVEDVSLVAPSLLSPHPGALITDPSRNVTFTWSPVDAGTQYRLEVEICGAVCSSAANTPTMETRATLTLDADGTYRWRVVVSREDGTGEATSEWQNFTVGS